MLAMVSFQLKSICIQEPEGGKYSGMVQCGRICKSTTIHSNYEKLTTNEAREKEVSITQRKIKYSGWVKA